MINIIYNDAKDEVMKEPFDSLKKRYQNNFESIKVSKFIFDYVHLLYDKGHKINLNCVGSYIDSPDWIKKKKTTINPINRKDKKCFQYAVTVALNHEQTGKYAERISKIKPLINKYKWEGINFSSEKDDWKKSEKNNVAIPLNVFSVKKEKICPAYASKNNPICEKYAIFLMISNGE